MIPHRTITIRPKALFGKNDESIVNKYIPYQIKHWIGSGRAALKYCIEEGANVGIPAFTCHVVKEAVENANATPVFFDSSIIADSGEIEKIAPKIDVLLLPYNFGFMPNMKDIVRICKRHSITLIEDCALALGSEYKGKIAGSFGDTGVWSFNISKNMGFVGGLIGTNNQLTLPELEPYPKLLLLKSIIQTIISPLFFHPKFYSFSQPLLQKEITKKNIPLDYSMPPYGKTIVINALHDYEKALQTRRKNFSYLMEELDGIIDYVKPLQNSNPTCASFVMFSEDRCTVMEKLLEEGVEVLPWQTYTDLSECSPIAKKIEDTFMVFETLRPKKDIIKFVNAVKKVIK